MFNRNIPHNSTLEDNVLTANGTVDTASEIVFNSLYDEHMDNWLDVFERRHVRRTKILICSL